VFADDKNDDASSVSASRRRKAKKNAWVENARHTRHARRVHHTFVARDTFVTAGASVFRFITKKKNQIVYVRESRARV